MMKALAVALLLAAGIAACFVDWSGSATAAPPAQQPVAPALPDHHEPRPQLAAVAIETTREPTLRTIATAADAGASTSECTLRIGDGYVFGDHSVRRRDERGVVDIYCQDIRDDVSLHCPGGCAHASPPMTGIGLPETAAAAAVLLVDAPMALDDHTLHLSRQPTSRSAGIGFVRRQTDTLKVWVVDIGDHPDALERTVRLGFGPVPARDGGGALQLPTRLGAPPAPTLQAIREAMRIGGTIPGDSFSSQMDGEFTVLGDLPPTTRLAGPAHVTVDFLSSQQVQVADGGAVFVGGRIGRDAGIVLQRGGAAGVAEDLEGRLRTDGYAFLFVGRDLLGTLDIRSYTTAVVLGDVRGTIRVRSYTNLFVRGRLLGSLDLDGSGWCTFYFQSFLGRAEVEQLPGNRSITLHLMQSDLPPGKHQGVGKWREVIVGDRVWERLAR